MQAIMVSLGRKRLKPGSIRLFRQFPGKLNPT
jgi:hypothetical protein